MRAAARVIRDYADLARVSNLPTVATNVLVGAALGAGGGAIDWGAAGVIAVGVALLYVGGMALNDVVDARVDARERPQRPIPSGRISLAAAGRFAIIVLLGGWAIVALHGAAAALFGGGLLVAIVVYDLIHKRFALSVLFLGACRGLVYLSGAAAVAWPLAAAPALWLSVGLAAYIVLLSVVARVETTRVPHARFLLALLLPVAAAAPVLGVRPHSWTFSILALAAVALWLVVASLPLLRRPPRIPAAVQGWLAGICLVDGFYLALLDRPALAAVAAGCFLLARLAHKTVAGS